MKILWVNPSFLDYRVSLYKKLYKLTNREFYLIYSKNRIPQRVTDKIEKALGNHAIGLSGESTIHIGKKGDFANSNITIPYQKGLYKAISSIDADVIIGEGFFQWTPYALFSAIKKKKPLLIAYERTAHTERNCPAWRKLYRKLIGKFASGYIANGKLTKDYLISYGIRENVIFTGGMCADSEKLAKATLEYKRNHSISTNKNSINYLFVGQMIERKGVEYLIKGWEKHIVNYPNDILTLVGDGPLLQGFREKYGKHSSIKFTGAIDYDLITSFYATANVFIIPTLEDNWSLVVPEAMACGLPIACSIYNGCYPELVMEGRNGKLFDPLKEETIIETLSYFHTVNLEEMGKESIKIESHYNPDTVAMNIYNACFEIINNNKNEN